jgi:hypothetical protein
MDSPRIRWSDLPLFLLRWSDAWLRPSIRHFAHVWDVSVDDDALQGGTRFRDMQRRKLFPMLRRVAQACAGWRGVRFVDRGIDTFFERVIEPMVVSRLERKRNG